MICISTNIYDGYSEAGNAHYHHPLVAGWDLELLHCTVEILQFIHSFTVGAFV